jgi:hypothetical protein
MIDFSGHTELGLPMPLRTRANRQRCISPQAGHALEILGHAIEYLADETLFECADTSDPRFKGRLEAIQLLNATDRQIYFECPEVPRLKERVLEILCAKCAVNRNHCVTPGAWSLRCLIQPWRGHIRNIRRGARSRSRPTR